MGAKAIFIPELSNSTQGLLGSDTGDKCDLATVGDSESFWNKGLAPQNHRLSFSYE